MDRDDLIEAFVNKESVFDTKNLRIYIPDVTEEPYRFWGFKSAKIKLSMDELVDKIHAYGSITNYVNKTDSVMKSYSCCLPASVFVDVSKKDETEAEVVESISDFVYDILDYKGVIACMVKEGDFIKHIKSDAYFKYPSVNIRNKIVLDIVEERISQIDSKRYDADHDDKYSHDELALAAAIYALPDDRYKFPWPLHNKPKKENRYRELVKAAALLIAELERIERKKV